MAKNNNNVNKTALTIFFIAAAVLLIGGLAIVPTITIQTASATAIGDNPSEPTNTTMRL